MNGFALNLWKNDKPYSNYFADTIIFDTFAALKVS